MNWLSVLVGRNELPVSVGEIPLLVRRGGCALKKMSRSLRSGADGVVAHRKISRLTTPAAPTKEASRHFLDVASTPPHEEGNRAH
jgi:thiamine monophosphate synthase